MLKQATHLVANCACLKWSEQKSRYTERTLQDIKYTPQKWLQFQIAVIFKF